MAEYQQLNDPQTGTLSTTVLRRADGAYIPDDPANRDRREFRCGRSEAIMTGMGKPLRDLTGQRFGFLVALVLGDKQTNGGTGAWWLCRCDCGQKKNLRSHDLVSGKIMSCGCQQQVLTDAQRTTHGMSKNNRTYRIWAAMLTRCRNPNQRAFRHYGGRGITVCERWSKFENFLTDMGEAPAGHSIERTDNDGDYDPGNCRWATSSEQANNTRVNIFIEWNGERLTRSQWEKRLGMAPTTLRGRLRSGWPLAKAMQPLGGKDGC